MSISAHCCGRIPQHYLADTGLSVRIYPMRPWAWVQHIRHRQGYGAMAEPREGIADRVKNGGSAIPVLEVCTVDHQANRQAGRAGDDVTFAPLFLL